MKKYFYSILAVVTLILSSCDFTPQSNFQPDIFFLQRPITNNSDTLNFYNSIEPNTINLDTIQVGDTVTIFSYFKGYSNNLTEIYIKQSADSSTAIILPNKTAMDSIFKATSNYSQGKFFFDIAATELIFPFKYIAKKASLDTKLTFIVVSDANFDYNQNFIIIKTPILPAAEQIQCKNILIFFCKT